MEDRKKFLQELVGDVDIEKAISALIDLAVAKDMPLVVCVRANDSVGVYGNAPSHSLDAVHATWAKSCQGDVDESTTPRGIAN